MAVDADDAAAKKRRRLRSTGGIDGISALPEQLQIEVFSRVGDHKALFRLAVTCRGWLRRFTDGAFLRELCPSPHHHRARLLGVFLQDSWFNHLDKATVQARMTMAAAPSSSSASAPVFFPALGSPLGRASRALTSFAAAGGDGDIDGTFDYAEVLAARRGIVLLRLEPRTPAEMDCHLFGVCNPVTGDRHVLPPLRWNGSLVGNRLIGYAIITAADGDSGSGGGNGMPAAARWTFSRLLVITQDGNRRKQGEEEVGACLHSYSAATRRWSTPATCLDDRVFSMVGGVCRSRSAVVHRGAAHWLCLDDGRLPYQRAARGDGDRPHLYRLSVDVATGTARVSLTRLPVRVGGKPFLFVGRDDELAVATVYPVHVTVWTPPPGGDAGAGDDGGTTWPRTSFRIPVGVDYLEERWFDFSRGSLLALFRGRRGVVFILDLETKVMEEIRILDFDKKAVSGARVDVSVTCVPYEMDLLEFFTLQLGGLSQNLNKSP